jgi:hypothetical protein
MLHLSDKGEVGIEWGRAAGNDYWVTAVTINLN